MNHSCAPNCYIKMKIIAIKDVYALRDIEEGEELTHDYTLTSIDQFAGMGFWTEDCKCGSKNLADSDYCIKCGAKIHS